MSLQQPQRRPAAARSQREGTGGAEADDRHHGVLGAAAADGVAVPGHAVRPVAVPTQPYGRERLAQLSGVDVVEPAAEPAQARVRRVLDGEVMKLTRRGTSRTRSASGGARLAMALSSAVRSTSRRRRSAIRSGCRSRPRCPAACVRCTRITTPVPQSPRRKVYRTFVRTRAATMRAGQRPEEEPGHRTRGGRVRGPAWPARRPGWTTRSCAGSDNRSRCSPRDYRAAAADAGSDRRGRLASRPTAAPSPGWSGPDRRAAWPVRRGPAPAECPAGATFSMKATRRRVSRL